MHEKVSFWGSSLQHLEPDFPISGTAKSIQIPPLQWARWISSRKYYVAGTLVVLIAVARTGIGFYSRGMLDIADAFPQPIPTYKGVSILSPALASGLQVSSPGAWHALHLVLVMALVCGLGLSVRRRFEVVEAQLFVFLVLMASSFSVVIFGIVGHYDYWMLVAAALIGLGKRWLTAVIGGILIGATNFEQGVVAIVALLLVVIALQRWHVYRCGIALLGAVLAKAAVQFWYLASDVGLISRGELLGDRITPSLEGFVNAWPLQLFSWYSAAWVVVLALLHIYSRKPFTLLFLTAGLLVLPGLAAITTLDGTRVFVATSSPALIWVLAFAADDFVNRGRRKELSLLSQTALAVMCITPGLLTWVGGSVRYPWGETFRRLSEFFAAS